MNCGAAAVAPSLEKDEQQKGARFGGRLFAWFQYSTALASSIKERMKLPFVNNKKNRLRDWLGDPALLLTGFAIGAGAMYIFDPEAGAGRRAAVGQTVARSGTAGKWLGGKAAGVVKSAWCLFSRKPRPQAPASAD